MSSNLTVTDQAVALHIRHQSWNSGEIARAIGNTTQKYVRKVLARRGLRITNPRRLLQDWERQSVIDAYADGEKVVDIAAEFGVKPQCIRRAARKAGLPGRGT